MQITLFQLRAFLAVSRYGSFTLAAEALHRTQPTITVQVRQLETALGLKLFDRSTRELRLTTVGLELVPVLSAMLRDLDAVVETAQNIRAMRTGIVRLACLPSVAASFLPARIAEFKALHPGISFLLKDDFGERVVAMVREGAVEFGITDAFSLPDELEAVPLVQDQMCAFYLDGHVIGEAGSVDVDELCRHELILMAQGSMARRIVDTAFAAKGRLAVPACEASYMSSAVGMVQAGLGVALLPASGVPLQIDPRLRSRKIEGPGFTRDIALVRLRNKTLSPAAAAFFESLLPPATKSGPYDATAAAEG